MIPIELKLVNVGTHKNFTYKFKPGIAGVLGANGGGKSTFSDYGMYFALTGNTPARYTKSDLLNWGSSEGYTVLVFEDNHIQYTLRRNLHDTKASLRWTEGKKKHSVTKAADVNARMAEIIGMPFDVLRETCFVSQGSFTEVVQMRHSERLKYFQRITGLKVAEYIRASIQTVLNEMPYNPDSRASLLSLILRLSKTSPG